MAFRENNAIKNCKLRLTARELPAHRGEPDRLTAVTKAGITADPAGTSVHPVRPFFAMPDGTGLPATQYTFSCWCMQTDIGSVLGMHHDQDDNSRGKLQLPSSPPPARYDGGHKCAYIRFRLRQCFDFGANSSALPQEHRTRGCRPGCRVHHGKKAGSAVEARAPRSVVEAIEAVEGPGGRGAERGADKGGEETVEPGRALT